MSSGHTGRGGRGNRRARRGAQRPRGADGQNGQINSSSAMLILSSSGHQMPAHVSPEFTPESDDDTQSDEPASAKVEVSGESESVAAMTGSENMFPAPGSTPPSEPRADAQREPHLRQANGSSERMQPYAPGMRTAPHVPLQRRAASEPASSASARVAASFVVESSAGEMPLDPPAPAPVRRSSRAEHDERGEHEPLRPEVRGEVGPLIDALHGLFEQDRSVASQGGATRCGICYLHFALVDMEYREAEGFYVCHDCARALGSNRLPMVRRQQRV